MDDEVKQELLAITEDIWSDEDYEEEPSRHQVVEDIKKGNSTSDVLDERENRLDTDWCQGRLKRKFLVILVKAGRLEEFNPSAMYSKSPKTMVIEGKRYCI